MIEIVNKPWDYRFVKKDMNHYLFVMCGSVGVFEITIELNENENLMYQELGLDYIDELARKIQFSPTLFAERNLPIDYFSKDSM